MEVEETPLPGVYVLNPVRHGDSRGFFSESWNRQRMRAHGLDIDFVQDNHSLSRQTGTLRGLHFQAPDRAQIKLVRCGRGLLYDASEGVAERLAEGPTTLYIGFDPTADSLHAKGRETGARTGPAVPRERPQTSPDFPLTARQPCWLQPVCAANYPFLPYRDQSHGRHV